MIYLDYQATTPMAPEVVEAMRPWLESRFGNPHSPHRMGREAAAAVEVAREQIVEALGAKGGKLYFTSGATEAANWALKGVAARLPADRRRLVAIDTEHACVLDTLEWLDKSGLSTRIIPVDSDGIVDLDQLSDTVQFNQFREMDCGLVAAMLVNNEIGVVQPIASIAAIAHGEGGLFFCDAVQGFGRVPLPIESCDLVALSGHKIHGPKGIGALWVRDGVDPEPLLHGGGQEGGIRSGTLSPALCVGFGAAAKLMKERHEADAQHVDRLWEVAWSILDRDWQLNGSFDQRYAGNLNIRLEGLDSARLISEVRDVAFSSGSACASGSGRPSHVLRALGLSDREARSSIRLGFGRYTTEEELVSAITRIQDAAMRQRTIEA